MAGDHKCPVCQSTFTRPQHVARHMRSHTGDRPYKCTTCGDQFARSDLLSRHVNKCHAADRPPNTTSRRRGSNSARVAAQQQQLQAQQHAQQHNAARQCDQCAQTAAACDLRTPCTSCSQRSLQCTYIRAAQAAQHKPGDPLSFNGGPFAPGGLSLPSMLSADPLYSANLNDPAGLNNFSSSLYSIPPLQSATDMNSHRTNTLPLPAPHASLNALDIPLHMYPSLPTAPSPASSQLSSAGGSHSSSANLSNWQAGSGAGLPGDLQALGHSLHAPRAQNISNDFLSGYDSYDSRPSTGSLPSPRSLIDMTQPPVDLYGYRRGHSHSQSDSGTHSDFSSSSSPALGMRGSGFSSHASLPTTHDVFSGNQAPPNAEDQQQLPRIDPPSFMYGHNMQVPRNDGQVSNAFGLLSLEELRNQAGNQFSFNPPPLDAGNSADLGPWSRPNSQPDMPRPSSHDGTVSSNTGASGAPGPRGSEQNSFGTTNGPAALSPATEARQMKEFWKAFMCDPYATGQTPDTETPGAMKTPLANGRPGYIRMHSLSKSTSLPPLRRSSGSNTNVNERHAYDDDTPHASMAQQLGHAHNTALPPKSIVNPADLRSYEEAIRSRPPPVLKFDPRLRGGQMDGIRLRGGGGGDDSEGTSSDANLSRRPSLADSLGAGDASNRAMKLEPGAADDSSRPSFKRLASQTLGPTTSKRVAHTKLGATGEAADSPSADSASGADDEKESGRDDSSDDEHERRGRPFDRGLPSVHNIRNANFSASANGRTLPVTSA